MPQNLNLKAVIKTKVGGVFGLGSSESVTEVIFNK